MPIVISRTTNLDAPIQVENLSGYVFTQEDGGHIFRIACRQNKQDLPLTGTINAYFMRANGTTIYLGPEAGEGHTGYTRVTEDGKAEVTLHKDCYNVPGRLFVSVLCTTAGSTVCIYAGAVNVARTKNGATIDSGSAVPDLNQFMQYIDDCIQATEGAIAATEGIDDIVLQQETQPVSETNKIWFPSATPEGVEVPTFEEFSEVKSATNQLINQKTISATGSGNKYIDYPIKNGKTYRFSIQSASTVTIATVSGTNTTIEDVGNIAPPIGYIDFTATSDAPKVLMYFRAAGTGLISEKNLIIENINDEITTIKKRLTELDVSADSSGNNYYDYSVTAGTIYLIETSSTAVVSVATVTSGGTTIQNIGDLPATANARKVFVASSNANRILFYFRAAGTGSIKPVDEMAFPWANKIWSSYGDSISWLYGWQTIINNNLLFANYVRNGKPGARISWFNATFGIDSNGIYTTGTAADTVHESLCAYDRIVKTIPADIPLIFAMGGTNDFLSNVPLGDLTFDTTSETDAAWKAGNPVGDYDIATFKGGLASMLMKLQYARPNALIVFGTLLNGIGAETGVNQYTEEVNTAGLKPSDYANAEKEVCAVFGVPVVDVFGTCGISTTNRATYLSDTVHPNGYGLNMLARCVTDGFKGIIPR